MLKTTPTPVAAAREPAHAGDAWERLREQAQERLRHFREGVVTPQAAYDLEKALKS